MASSNEKINIPANSGGENVFILTDIVDCEIPLLLSKSSMKKAKAILDCANDKVTMFGKDIQLCYTSSGYFCIPITTKQYIINEVGKDHQQLNCFLQLAIYLKGHFKKKRNHRKIA